jgi:hypothetical protein
VFFSSLRARAVVSFCGGFFLVLSTGDHLQRTDFVVALAGDTIKKGHAPGESSFYSLRIYSPLVWSFFGHARVAFFVIPT